MHILHIRLHFLHIFLHRSFNVYSQYTGDRPGSSPWSRNSITARDYRRDSSGRDSVSPRTLCSIEATNHTFHQVLRSSAACTFRLVAEVFLCNMSSVISMQNMPDMQNMFHMLNMHNMQYMYNMHKMYNMHDMCYAASRSPLRGKAGEPVEASTAFPQHPPVST